MSQNEKSVIRIELPFPPSTNAYWRHVAMGRGVRVLISERGRKYRDQVVASCCSVHVTGLNLGGRLRVTVTLHAPDRRRRDLDNYNKGLLDALTEAGVWGDDSQIDDLRNVRGQVVKGGKVVVEIEELAALAMMVA